MRGLSLLDQMQACARQQARERAEKIREAIRQEERNAVLRERYAEKQRLNPEGLTQRQIICKTLKAGPATQQKIVEVLFEHGFTPTRSSLTQTLTALQNSGLIDIAPGKSRKWRLAK